MSKGETAAMTLVARSSEVDDRVEYQADRLASFILMPGAIVKRAYYRIARTPGDKITMLADRFAVSRKAMEIRLREMNLM